MDDDIESWKRFGTLSFELEIIGEIIKSINYTKYRILLKVGKESRKVYIKKCFEGK